MVERPELAGIRCKDCGRRGSPDQFTEPHLSFHRCPDCQGRNVMPMVDVDTIADLERLRDHRDAYGRLLDEAVRLHDSGKNMAELIQRIRSVRITARQVPIKPSHP
jgi:NAD-dependent SIR2 family protein deacetylase